VFFIFLIFSWLVAKYIKSYLQSAEPNALARVQSHTWGYTEGKGRGWLQHTPTPTHGTRPLTHRYLQCCGSYMHTQRSVGNETGHDDDGDDDDDASDSCGKRATILVYQTDNASANNKSTNNNNSRRGKTKSNKKQATKKLKANNNRASLTCVYTMFVAVFPSCCYCFLRPFGPGCEPCPVPPPPPASFSRPSRILRPPAVSILLWVQCPFSPRPRLRPFSFSPAVEAPVRIKNILNQLQDLLDQSPAKRK